MGQILVRNLDDAVIERLKHDAEAKHVSLEQHLRDVLSEAALPDKSELWRKAERLRTSIHPVAGDSTALIREDRDNDGRQR